LRIRLRSSYRSRFAHFLRLTPNQFRRPGLNSLHIALGVLPFVVIGFGMYKIIKEELFGAGPVLVGLIAGGLLMIAADRYRGTIKTDTLDELTYTQALGIGLFQCLAVWPGFSRSGSTISGGMLIGVGQKTAAEFSFLLSVPIMFAASGYDLYKSWHLLTLSDLPVFLIGLAAAFVVAILAIVTFLKLISKLRLSWFAYYRFVLAGVLYFVLDIDVA